MSYYGIECYIVGLSVCVCVCVKVEDATDVIFSPVDLLSLYNIQTKYMTLKCNTIQENVSLLETENKVIELMPLIMDKVDESAKKAMGYGSIELFDGCSINGLPCDTRYFCEICNCY